MSSTTTRTWMLICCLLAAMGCGDDGSDGGSSSNATSNATSNMTTADAGGGDTGGGDEDTSEPPVAPTPEELAGAVDAPRYMSEVQFFAQARPQGSPHWQASQDRCAEVFEAAGFAVERHDYGFGVNVVGVLPGTTRPEEVVVISAHYDHLPGCEGADDNASGVAGVMEAAQALGGENLYERTLIVACWDQEEDGLIGAEQWAARAARQGMMVHASYVLETMAYASDAPSSQFLPTGFDALFPDAAAFISDRDNRGDFIAAIGDDLNTAALADFVAHADRLGLPVAQVVVPTALKSNPALGDLRRSDHDAFWQQDWPGIMLTDTANFRNPNYHCFWGSDSVDTLDMDFATKVVQATVGAAASQAVPVGAGERGVIDATTDPNPPEATCDITTQQGCEDGERCTAIFSGGWSIQCIPEAESPVADGETCTRIDDVAGQDTCEAGSYCAFWHVPQSDPQERICHAMCASDDGCADGEECLRLGGVELQIGICTPTCDPRDPGAVCPDGTECVLQANVDPRRNSFLCFPVSPGTAAAGDSCADARCAEGLTCNSGAVSQGPTCVPWCEDDSACPTGSSCLPEGVTTLGETFGRCIPDSFPP